MTKAKKGDTVKVHYTGTLDDGSVFDSSSGREPLSFTVGGGEMIPGFDKAVESLAVGESKEVKINSDEAYGKYYEELTRIMQLSDFPKDMELTAGQKLQMTHKDGTPVVVLIKEVTDTTVTIDANHPLAGKDLNFKIELVEIK